jgi:hypothetical protein
MRSTRTVFPPEVRKSNVGFSTPVRDDLCEAGSAETIVPWLAA